MIELVPQDVIVRIHKEARWPGPGMQRRVLLREKDGDRILHLWAGDDDGDGVALEIAEKKPARPLMYDVTLQSFTLGALTVARAVLLDSDSIATLWLVNAEGVEHPLDMKPTDAVNLALRARAPIFIEEAVLAEVGIPAEELWAALEAEEAEFAAHLRDHAPPDTEVSFPAPEMLEWRSIVPPEWRLFEPTG